MSTRLDLTIQKHPDHEEGIRALASRDPSGTLKYLDWGAKVLASGQALAPEIADVIELFHRFSGGRQRAVIRSDLYSYRPQDLATLRDALLKIKRAQDRKRKKRERLYRIEGLVDVDIIHDSPGLVVRHIKNKQASVHYGLGTKWCISMLREGYFENYETQNATFFFFERKVPKGDEFDKVALMVPRTGDEDAGFVEAFTSIDRRVDMMMLAKAYGSAIFDIFREVYERSERYPGSAMARVYNGSATKEEIESVCAILAKGTMGSYESESLLEAICCNDATPWAILEATLRHAPKLSAKRIRRYRSSGSLVCTIEAALLIHPLVPDDVCLKLGKSLRRRHIDTNSIRRTRQRIGSIGVTYEVKGKGRMTVRVHNGRRRLRRQLSLSQLRKHAESLVKRAARAWKKVKTLEGKKKKAEAVRERNQVRCVRVKKM